MLNQFKIMTLPFIIIALSACDGGPVSTTTTNSTGSTTGSTIETNATLLGKRLFSDTRLSFNQTQSCATCHNPEKGFIDDRDNGVARAVSLGDDGVSLGNRNSPTVSYRSLVPDFNENNENSTGGHFLDGRAGNLTDQAGEPFLNAVEMGMPDRASVIARIVAVPDYVAAFEALYGATVFDDTNTAFSALSDSLASFQESKEVSPFNSKFDRAIAGTYTFTNAEQEGQNLFFAGRASCDNCHRLEDIPNLSPTQLFTNHRYENVGVPINQTLNNFLQSTGQQADLVNNGDQGLLANPAVNTSDARGRFRVPSLRNVAVTAPYMHNGVFANLQTVIEFYDHVSGNDERTINPETNQPWRNPEVDENISLFQLEMQGFSDRDVDNLECFLRTLTDAKFEGDLPALRAGLNCS